tara:strand:- start:1281 stop:1856 length:576 start_codon:yes stop_codon:yes gene_type:complete
MSELLHLDDLIGTSAPPSISRTNPKKGHGAMNKQRLFDDPRRGLAPGGRRRKKSRKKKRRKKSRGKSGKKKTRKKTATVHKFEIVKRNPLTIKIFKKKGKKWVLVETHVSQKGGVGTRSHKKSATRFKSAQLNFFKTKKLEGKTMHDIQKEWVNIVRLKQWSNWIPNNPNSQSAGKRKTKRRKRRRKKTRR